MDQVTRPLPGTESLPLTNTDAKLPAPWLNTAQYFLSLALRYNYLSNGLRHKQSRQILTDRKERSRSRQVRPPATDRWSDGEGVDSLDSERAYLNHVAQVGRLTSSEEYCLAKRVTAGDAVARNALIEANLGLVVMLARNYRRPDVPLIDLIAEGNFGLIAATNSFNPELGFRFSTYAKWAVRHAIERKLPNLMSVQRALTSQTFKTEAVTEFKQAIDIDIDALEGSDLLVQVARAAAFGMTPEPIKPYIAADRLSSDESAMTACSFSLNEETLATLTIPEDEEPPHAAHAVRRGVTLARALTHLSERERTVITERYALASNDIATLDQLAQRFHISVERVRQIECAALKKLDLLLRSAGETPDSLL